MDRRPGCLSGLMQLVMLKWLFDWLQQQFGFGRKQSCFGVGCGMILFVIFVVAACSILTGTNWTDIGFNLSGIFR